jgi:hypothetical protein
MQKIEKEFCILTDNFRNVRSFFNNGLSLNGINFLKNNIIHFKNAYHQQF